MPRTDLNLLLICDNIIDRSLRLAAIVNYCSGGNLNLLVEPTTFGFGGQILRAVVDETRLWGLDYPNCSVLACTSGVFFRKKLLCSKGHTIADSFGLKTPAKR
jgi:hypothetical protein